MKTIRLLALCGLILALSSPAWSGKEDVSDGKTPTPPAKADATKKPADPKADAKKPPVCAPNAKAGVNTLEDLYRANGGELSEFLQRVLVLNQAAAGTTVAATAEATPSIDWTVTTPEPEAAREPKR